MGLRRRRWDGWNSWLCLPRFCRWCMFGWLTQWLIIYVLRSSCMVCKPFVRFRLSASLEIQIHHLNSTRNPWNSIELLVTVRSSMWQNLIIHSTFLSTTKHPHLSHSIYLLHQPKLSHEPFKRSSIPPSIIDHRGGIRPLCHSKRCCKIFRQSKPPIFCSKCLEDVR